MPSRWITCESNAVRAPYQRVQGDQPVVIRRVVRCRRRDGSGEPRGSRTLAHRVADGDPRRRIGSFEVWAQIPCNGRRHVRVGCWGCAERAEGIAPSLSVWKTAVLLLDDTRMVMRDAEAIRRIASLDEGDEDMGARAARAASAPSAHWNDPVKAAPVRPAMGKSTEVVSRGALGWSLRSAL